MKTKNWRKMLGLFAFTVMLGIMMPAMNVEAAPNADGSVTIDEVNFPDAVFREYVKGFDDDSDGILSVPELEAVEEIDVHNRGISSLVGIEYFVNLLGLVCDYNHQITDIDVSNNTALEKLWCEYNSLTSLDVSNNMALQDLRCTSNELTSLDVSNNTALEVLYCTENTLTSLDVSNNKNLLDLICDSTALASLDVSNNTALQRLVCDANALTSLDVSNNTALEKLWCGYNSLTSLDVSNNTVLQVLECGENALTSLDVSNNTALEWLDCYDNQLTSLDVSNNTALEKLWCEYNSLTSLDVSNNTALESLLCYENQMEFIDLSVLTPDTCSISYQSINLGEISTTGIQLGTHGQGMDLSKVTNVTGAIYDAATGKLTGYTASPITYTYEAVDSTGTVWPMNVTLNFTIKEEHTHSYGTTYSSDANNHWNTCACGATGNVSAHVPGPAATEESAQTCTVCGYVITPALGHQHSFGTTYSSDANNHWNTCECGATGNVSAHTPGPAATEESAQTCTVCGYEIAPKLEHVHKYGTTYSSDANNHWNICACGATENVSAHTPGAVATETTAQTCTVCGYVIAPALGHQHSYGTTYSSDANNHWNTCACGAKDNVTAHDFEWVVDKPATESAAGSKHEECGICGYEKMSVEIPKLQPAEDDGEDVDDDDEAPVQANVKDDVPKTGDSSAMTVIVWGSIALLSGAGIAVFGKKRANGR